MLQSQNVSVGADGPARRGEPRDDVLVYTTKPLPRDLEVTGPVRAILYVQSTAADTDFTAKLVDVFPSGEARNLTDGMLRLRYRDGLEQRRAGEARRDLSHRHRCGRHQQRFLAGPPHPAGDLEQQLSRVSTAIPTPGARWRMRRCCAKAGQTVLHGRKYPSHLLLPVVPELISSTAPRYPGVGTPKGSSYRAR